MVEGKIIAHLYSSVIARNKEGKYLTILEKNNKGWFCPCGHVEKGESFQEAAIRETKEESWIDVQIKGVLRMRSKAKPDGQISLTCIFYAEPVDQNQTPKDVEDEHTICAKWVSLEEMKEMKSTPPGFRDKDFLEWAIYLENGGQIFPPALVSELYSDFPENYDKAFTLPMRNQLQKLASLKGMIKDVENRAAVEVIGQKKFLFAKNPLQPIEEVLEELSSKDLEMVKREFEVASMCKVVALKMKEVYPRVSKVKIVGSEELCKEIRSLGVECETISEPDKGVPIINSDKFEEYPIDESVDFVLIGLDTSFNFFKQCVLSMYIQQGVKVISASNEETLEHNGIHFPGTQKIVDTVQSSLKNGSYEIEALIKF